MIAQQLQREINVAIMRGETFYPLARRCGVQPEHFKLIAAGVTKPRIDTAAKIAAALGFTIELIEKPAPAPTWLDDAGK